MPTKTLRQRIVDLSYEHGLDFGELEELAGVPRGTLPRIKEANNASLEKLEKIAQGLDRVALKIFRKEDGPYFQTDFADEHIKAARNDYLDLTTPQKKDHLNIKRIPYNYFGTVLFELIREERTKRVIKEKKKAQRQEAIRKKEGITTGNIWEPAQARINAYKGIIKDLKEKTGIEDIIDLESGARSPTTLEIEAICSYFNLEPAYLIPKKKSLIRRIRIKQPTEKEKKKSPAEYAYQRAILDNEEVLALKGNYRPLESLLKRIEKEKDVRYATLEGIAEQIGAYPILILKQGKMSHHANSLVKGEEKDNYVGEELKHYRTLAGISANRMATRLGVSPSNIIGTESGKRVMNLKALEEVCKYLGLTINYLVKKPISYK